MIDINKKVFLLKMLKRESDETINDVIIVLSDTGVFTPKEGKKIKKELERDGFIKDGRLTMIGIEEAKRAEMEFKL